MGLIAPSDQERLRSDLAQMTHNVRLLFFSQTFGCETCEQAQQVLAELPRLSDRITVEEVNFVLEREKAAEYGIDRVPAIAVLAEATEEATEEAFKQNGRPRDTRMRFVGVPAGYEFLALIQAVRLAGGVPSELSEASRARLAAIDRPVTVQVFSTPTCPHCPRAIALAHEMAFASPHITAFAVEVTEFPDLARKYRVTGVPKTVVDERIEILGAIAEDEFIAQALALPGEPADSAPQHGS
jgi:glutaredoxin-like protein